MEIHAFIKCGSQNFNICFVFSVYITFIDSFLASIYT